MFIGFGGFVEGKCYCCDGVNVGIFLLLYYVGDWLVCVESVNVLLDYMVVCKLFEIGRSLVFEVVCDLVVFLKNYV